MLMVRPLRLRLPLLCTMLAPVGLIQLSVKCYNSCIGFVR